MATIKVPNPEWHEGAVGIDKWIRISMTRADMENYLGKDNQDEYTPVDDYNPATKKYVDDSKSQVIQQMNSSLLDKVDKEDGKGLSTNDYTTEEKNKLNNISNNLVSGISVSNSTSSDRVKITYSDTDTTTGDMVSKDLYLQGATSEFAGLMISSDKTKLDGVEDSANNYSLPAATDTNLGGIQTGYTQSGKNYPVKLDDGNKAYVNIPWSDTIYDVATQTENGLMSSTDKKKLDGVENGANNYTLPKASTTQLGGIQLGFTEQGKNYPLELDENGKAYVNIPWSNTTYSPATSTTFGTVKIGTQVPEANGTASAGSTTGGLAASVDHVHPLQTTVSGNAGTATKLQTARTISLTGAVTGSTTFDGSSNKSITTTLSGFDASKITSGTISIDRLPKGALERLVVVASDTERYKLTENDVQLGDTVKVESTGLMYYVVDEDNLANGAGYSVYTAGSATSVPWSGVTDKPSTFTPSTHTHTKSQITDFPSSLKNPNSLTISLNGTSQGAYDGSAAKSFNITAASVGALASGGTAVNASKVANSLVLKLKSGTTEGTDLYTFNGSAGKTLDIVQGSNVTLTAAAGKLTISATNTTYGLASSSSNGLMSASDKTKLDGISAGANNYTHPTSSGNKHIPSGGSSGQILRWSADGTAVWGADNNTTYGIATNSTNGLIKPWYNHTAASTGPTAGSNSTAVAVNAITTTSGRYYALEMDNAGRGFVNVPWSNTTYSTFKAATSSAAGGTGLVPAPAAGKQTSFLRGDGTWVVPTNTNTTYTFASGTGAFTVTPSGGSAQTVSIGKPATAGAADTATKLSTARTINGTSFNGSANITTANWGTSRTLTIGNTGKSVNGSANVSWSLGEIGAAASSHTHSYLPLSGGTLTGALTFSNYSSKLTTGETISMKNSKGQVQDVIRCYDDGDTDANGSELVIQAGGNVYIGSGESASALKTAIGTNSGETMKISSDSNIEFYTNCQTIANRVGVILDSSRAFYPNSNNTGTLGTSSNKWNNVYATTFTGSLSGNASTASKLGTATVGSTSKPIYLNAGTATALSATVGAANKPVYMNAGTVTACSSTVGSATVPVYMNAGTVTQCTASSVFSNLSNSGNNISITVAGQNRTLTPAHAAKAGYVERDRGNNTVTTLASLPTSKRLILANLSTATTISVSSGMNIGDEIYIVCTPSATFTQPIPNSGSFRSMSGTSLSVTSGVHFEISILCIATSGVMYSISIKEKD